MTSQYTLLSIVGARPQFIKLAPLIRAVETFNARGGAQLRHLTLHTGQHYDASMSDIFFEELEIPHADINLGVGSGSHGAQTAAMLSGIEQVLIQEKPDMVIVFGDTNSTVAGALAAAKLHLPIAHIEAGLRSFNRRMPEEINRVVADHLSDLLFAPTETAVQNLHTEGLGAKTVPSGDIMYDTVLLNRQLAERKSDIVERLGLAGQPYAVATIHRAENTDHPERLEGLLNMLNEVASRRYPVVFPMHPRTRNLLPKFLPGWSAAEGLRLVEPLGYLDMLRLVGNARLALTDSGGLQKEAMFLNCPCITLRDETEWVETVSAGANVITGADPEAIRQAVAQWEERLAAGPADFSEAIRAHFGGGDSALLTLETIVAKLTESHSLTLGQVATA